MTRLPQLGDICLFKRDEWLIDSLILHWCGIWLVYLRCGWYGTRHRLIIIGYSCHFRMVIWGHGAARMGQCSYLEIRGLIDDAASAAQVWASFRICRKLQWQCGKNWLNALFYLWLRSQQNRSFYKDDQRSFTQYRHQQASSTTSIITARFVPNIHCTSKNYFCNDNVPTSRDRRFRLHSSGDYINPE